MRSSVAWLLTTAAMAACAIDGGGTTSSAPTFLLVRSTPATAASTPADTPTPPASATPPAALDADALAAALDADTIEEHLAALQEIAEANGGHRATGSPGYAASLEYASGELERLGYDVRRRDWQLGGRAGTNLLVERPGVSSRVVMLGAHLDSVAAGPGINDDGSGVAAVLATAAALAQLPPPVATVRLALWDAEEGGPFGSAAYVAELTVEERERVGAYLNLDMIGSPNAIRLVYAEADAAPGSDAVTDAFAAYFEDLDLPWQPIDLEGDSDHGPFIAAGIPTGGLFSGGIEPVTEAQAALFGAQPGVPADACSHAACDTMDNVDPATVTEMARAAAAVLARLASTN